MRRWYEILIGSTLLAAFALVWPGYGSAGALAGDTPQASAPQSTARADIKALRAAAWEQIRSLLTDEQKASLDAAELGQWQGGGHRGFRGCGGKAGPARAELREQHILNRLTQKLSLTDEQRTTVQGILDKTLAARQARFEAARAAFRAALTPEQVAKLDEMKGQRGALGSGRWGHGHGQVAGAAATGPLQLTPEQKTQAHQVFGAARSDVQKVRADAREQIRAVLTDAQKTEFDAQFPAMSGSGAGKMHGPHAGWGAGGTGDTKLLDRLTARLNLTDTQRNSVQSVLDNLHTSVQARLEQARAASGGAAVPDEAATPRPAEE